MLPDNNMIEISYEKQRAPEILMSPEKYGLELNCKWDCNLLIISHSWNPCQFYIESRFGLA